MRAFTERCVRGIEADEENCRRWGERSLGLATALNPVIGYEAAAEVAKEAYRTGKSVPDVVLERGILTADELAERLDPASLTQPRPLPRPAGPASDCRRPDRRRLAARRRPQSRATCGWRPPSPATCGACASSETHSRQASRRGDRPPKTILTITAA